LESKENEESPSGNDTNDGEDSIGVGTSFGDEGDMDLNMPLGDDFGGDDFDLEADVMGSDERQGDSIEEPISSGSE
jgi:hypothetical protein